MTFHIALRVELDDGLKELASTLETNEASARKTALGLLEKAAEEYPVEKLLITMTELGDGNG